MKNGIHFFILRSLSLIWLCATLALQAAYGRDEASLLQAQTRERLRSQRTDSINVPTDSVSHKSDSLKLNADSTFIANSDSLKALLNDTALTALADTAKMADSTKTVVVVGLSDPLDTLSNRIFGYQVLESTSFARQQFMIDTSLTRYEINNPVMRRYFAGAYLGNAGLSYCPIGFEDRHRPSDFMFTDNIAIYMHRPEEMRYYQTQMPYTMIEYSSAGSRQDNESILSVVHSQNVNKKWNIGLDYDIVASAGQFTNQNSADNAISLFSAYRGSQYSIYTNFNWNNIRMRENGGLSSIENFYLNEDDAATNHVRSEVGKTVLRNRSFYLTQSYSPRSLSFLSRKGKGESDSVNVSRFALTHTLKYEWNKREFSDTATYVPGGGKLFGSANTHDSLYFRRLENHIELMLKEQSRNKLTAGFSVGLLTEADRIDSDIVPTGNLDSRPPQEPPSSGWGGEIPPVQVNDSTVYYRASQRYFNTAVTGRFFNHTGKTLNWDFSGRLYFTGYKAGNIMINGAVQYHFFSDKGTSTLSLGGSLENAKPSYFMQAYTSNWQKWDNSFNPSQEIRLRGEFFMPHRKLKAGIYLSQLNNYIFFNKEAVPEQASSMLTVVTGLLEKDLQWWKLHFRFKIYGQLCSNPDIIPLPAVAGYQSTYFETWLVPSVLRFQLGWDFNMNSRYYAYAYMPSSGMFYIQDEQRIGNFPFVDAFMNFQIKKARFFVKTEGLYSLLQPMVGKEYFNFYRYPMNTFRVKFGVSWAFYD